MEKNIYFEEQEKKNGTTTNDHLGHVGLYIPKYFVLLFFGSMRARRIKIQNKKTKNQRRELIHI